MCSIAYRHLKRLTVSYFLSSLSNRRKLTLHNQNDGYNSSTWVTCSCSRSSGRWWSQERLCRCSCHMIPTYHALIFSHIFFILANAMLASLKRSVEGLTPLDENIWTITNNYFELNPFNNLKWEWIGTENTNKPL